MPFRAWWCGIAVASLGCLLAGFPLSAPAQEPLGELPSVQSVAEGDPSSRIPAAGTRFEDWSRSPSSIDSYPTASKSSPGSIATMPGASPLAAAAPDRMDPIDGWHDFWASNHFLTETGTWLGNLLQDQVNFYSLDNLAWIAAGVAAVAPLANTNADQEFRNWYQGKYGNDARLTQAALYVKNLGEGSYMIPAFFAGGLFGMWLDAYFPSTTPLDEWFGRTLRAWATGAPTLLALQYALGPERPYYSSTASHWDPFHGDHGASGHAFIGSIPFLTAAEMVDDPWLRGVLFAASFATGWSRIQTDDHYLSQVILGWWIAYRSVLSVSQTQEQSHRCWDIFPSVTPDGGAQVNVFIRY